MQIFKDLYEPKLESTINSCVITIGNFDGLHKGHRQLIKKLKTIGAYYKKPCVVLSFSPHPIQVLSATPQQHFQLFPEDDLIEQLDKEKVDYFILHPFTKKFSQTSPKDFFDTVLKKVLKATALVVGSDFSFGRLRQGGIEELRGFCTENHIELHVVSPVQYKGQRISSTRIRQAAQRGDMESVQQLLQRSFYIKGQVQKGEGRGKKLGFPTANIESQGSEFLKKGVYFSHLYLRGQKYNGVTNLGYRPTFSSNEMKIYIETFIMENLPDFYGETVKVEFLSFLRDEVKFESAEHLVFQIEKDVKKAKEFFQS